MIRVGIVADVRLYREGLAQVLSRRGDIAVVATTAGTNGSLSWTADSPPDVVLTDLVSPPGLPVIERVVAAAPGAKVIVLGVGEGDQDAVATAEAGAVGYVPREASVEDLITVIKCVARGEAFCSPRVAGALWRRVALLASERSHTAVEGHLTRREREITRLLDEGLSNKEIAVRLGIEVATVKNHVHNILEKLQVHRRGEAAARVRGLSRPRPSGSGALR